MRYIIASFDKNLLIGCGDKKPWQDEMSGDIDRLQELTFGNTVIMGRKTFEIIGKPLLGRQNIVLSRHSPKIAGVLVVGSLSEAYDRSDPNKDIYIIGGGQTFKHAIYGADVILATEIEAEFNGDIYFPKIGEDWRQLSREDHMAGGANRYNYSFVNYIRA